MSDSARTKGELLRELDRLRSRVAALEKAEGQHRRARKKAVETEGWLRTLVETAPSIIFSVDRTGKILFINHTLPGYGREATLGTNVCDYVGPKYHDIAKSTIEEVFATGEPGVYEASVAGTGGESRWFTTHVAAVKHHGKVAQAVVVATDITGRRRSEAASRGMATRQRRQAEEALQESEERYSSLFAGMQEGFALHESEVDGRGRATRYRFVDVNPAFELLTGLAKSEVVGKTLDEVLPETADEWREMYDRVAAAGEPVRFERSSDGLESSFEIVCFSPSDGQFATIMEDITERKRIGDALRASEQRYRDVVEQSLQGVVVLPAGEWRPSFANTATANITGYDLAEIAQMTTSDVRALLHPEDIEKAARAYGSFVADGHGTRECQFRIRRKDGAWAWLEAFSTFIDYEGQSAVQTVFMDVTARVEAVDALRESEQRYRTVVEHQTEMVCRFTTGCIVTFVNEAYCRYFGRSRDELLGHSFLPLIPEEDRRNVSERLSALSAESPQLLHIHRIIRPDGSVGWQEWANTAVVDAAGTVREVQAVGRDVTARMMAEEERARLAAAVDQADESIVITDAAGHITYVNPCFERMTGYSREEAVGKSPGIVSSGKHEESFYLDMWKTISSGGTWRGHFTNRRKDGTLFEEDAVVSPVCDDAGRVVSYVAVKRDVTRQMALEHQLRHSQKMEALGRLAGGIAHDFTNALTMIINCVQLAKQGVEQGSESEEFLDHAVAAVKKVSKLTAQLLAFSQQQPISLRVSDLNRVVGGATAMLAPTLEAGVRLETALSDCVLPVEVDTDQIEQVVVHMAVNACDAMPQGGGVLTVETMRILLSEHEAEQIGSDAPAVLSLHGWVAMLRISDSGEGMSDDARDRIFDPFFTTKESGRTTGLGLSTSYAIVRRHGGTITVQSQPGLGSTFTVYLPLAGPPDESQPGGETRRCGPGKTVLVIEPDPLARMALVNIIQSLGCGVFETEDATQGIALFREKVGKIDLVVTAAAMPGMNGRELVDCIRGLSRGVKVLFTSGFPRATLERRGIITPEERLLVKPFVRSSTGVTVMDAIESTVQPDK